MIPVVIKRCSLVACVCLAAFIQPSAAAQQPDPPQEAPPAEAEPIEPAPPAEETPASSLGPIDSRYAGEVPEGPNEQGSVRMRELILGEPVPETTIDRPFVQDMKINLQLRNFYFHRDRFDNSHAEAWAQGGSLALKSGYFADVFAVGAVVYTSLPIQAEDGRQGSGLLDTEPGGYTLRLNPVRGEGFQPFLEQRIHQDSYVVLGQIYGEFKLHDSLQFNIGRQEYNTPFVNKHDVRMTPKTFEGVSLTGRQEGSKEGSQWRYGLGYLTKMKNWTDPTFYDMNEAIGVENDRGLILGGVNYSENRWSLGAIDYYMDDVINIFYSEGSYGWKLSDRSSIKLSAQFTDQRSTGDELITGDDFDVQQYGIKTDIAVGAATFTFAYTEIPGGHFDVRSPWGGYPGYTSVQVNDFNRADEDAFLAKVSYDFSHFGLDGLSAYALWVHGNDRSGLTDDDNPYNEDEWDLNLQWVPSEGRFKGLNARVRYAEIDQRGSGGEKQKDFRVIFNYDFAVK